MKRLALLLPLLALAAVPCLAQDPATNAPILPAWFGDVRLGMSTNEFAALGFESSFREAEEWGYGVLVEARVKTRDGLPFEPNWSAWFDQNRLVTLYAESDSQKEKAAVDAMLAELTKALGAPNETNCVYIIGFLDPFPVRPERVAWTNETRLVGFFRTPADDCSCSGELLVADRSFASARFIQQVVFYDLVPDNLDEDFRDAVETFALGAARAGFEAGEYEQIREFSLQSRKVLLHGAPSAKRLETAEELLRIARDCDARIRSPATPSSPAEKTHAESAENAETNSRAEGEENASTGESSPDGATDMDEISVVLERGFATRVPLPPAIGDEYIITRIYDSFSDSLFYDLAPSRDSSMGLDYLLFAYHKFHSIAEAIRFVDDNAVQMGRPLIVYFQWDFLPKEIQSWRPRNQIRIPLTRFIQVVTQNDWDELQSARQSGSLDQYAKTKRRGRPKDIRQCDYLLKSEREELKGLLNDPIETLAPSCGTLIEEFLRSYAPENAEEEGHAESAESESHAESAENAEPEPHAESAEGAK